MTPLLPSDMSNPDMNMFDCISMQKEYYVPPKEVPIYDYMVSVYPRHESKRAFSFVYGLFEPKRMAFSNNQDTILGLSNSVFEGAIQLTTFEQDVLNIAFKKSIKSSPTLSGRK